MNNDPQITVLAGAELFPSPTNPRKKFDAARLAELTASIELRGVKMPLLVRPVGDRYEIVAGERRFKAGTAVKLKGFPCIVEEMTDADVLELQLIENLQREDLDPLEESDHYFRMLELHSEEGAARYTVAQLSEKIGKPVGRIYKLLKLRDLPKNMRTALAKGTIGANLASLVARIPEKSMREKVAQEILNGFDDEPMSQREAIAHIREQFMVELKGAPFAMDDADLLTVEFAAGEGSARVMGGACQDCPLRTGNNRELYGDETRGDICTNPPCYAEKREAAWKQATEAARADGKKVISEKESETLFYYGSNEIAWNSSFYELDKQPPADVLTDGQKRVPTWRKLIEGGPCQVDIAVARTPKGKIIEIADRRHLMEASKRNGHEGMFDKTVHSGSDLSAESAKFAKEQRDKAKFDAACRVAGFHELKKALEGWDDTPEFWGHEPKFWLLMLENALDCHAGADGRKLMCKMLDLDPVKAGGYEDHVKPVLAHAKTFAKDSRKLAALTVMALISQSLRWSGVGSDWFGAFSKWVGLDVAALKKNVRVELREKGKPKKAASKSPATAVKKVASKAPKKGKEEAPEGTRGDKILAALKTAGSEGVTTEFLANSLGTTKGAIAKWFSVQGKLVKDIRKAGVGHYRMGGK